MSQNADPNWKFYMVELSSALRFLDEQNQSSKAALPDSYAAAEAELVLGDAREAAQALHIILTNAFPAHTESHADNAIPPDWRQVRN